MFPVNFRPISFRCCGLPTLTSYWRCSYSHLWHNVKQVVCVFIWSALGLGINELLYFRVISPEEIGYIFSAAPAKDFGGDFVSTLPYSEFNLLTQWFSSLRHMHTHHLITLPFSPFVPRHHLMMRFSLCQQTRQTAAQIWRTEKSSRGK